ncbi:MAG: hypothetical protein LC667_11750 [Thioalkalivibrio sp.]|nr:hypothetical protein [Thioalkalivibrio sp.]
MDITLNPVVLHYGLEVQGLLEGTVGNGLQDLVYIGAPFIREGVPSCGCEQEETDKSGQEQDDWR